MDTRFERILGKVKGFRLNFSEKSSLDDKEGEEGEFRINKKQNKSDLYVKMDKKWAQLGLGITKSNLSTNGHVEFGNGLIAQWGRASSGLDAEGSFTITFPEVFPTECFSVVQNINIDPAVSDPAMDFWSQILDVTKSNFKVQLQWNGVGGADPWNVPIHWIAIGN